MRFVVGTYDTTPRFELNEVALDFMMFLFKHGFEFLPRLRKISRSVVCVYGYEFRYPLNNRRVLHFSTLFTTSSKDAKNNNGNNIISRTVEDLEKDISELKAHIKAIIDANSDWAKDMNVKQAIRSYNERITALTNLLTSNQQGKE